jgi:hypothetical protein
VFSRSWALNLQVLRRTIATLARTKSSVKDAQGVLGHGKADITANVYIQPIESGVRQTLDGICSELVAKSEAESRELGGKFGTFWYGGRFGTACK